MTKVLYTANAHVTGGRDGHARSADGELQVDLQTPTEMGGAGKGTNPEELFAVGYAASFGSTLGVLARRRGLDAGEITIDSMMSLLPTADGSFQLAATLEVALPSIEDRETAAQLARHAHQLCPYSNATRGNIDVDILLDGKSVSSNRREPQE